MGRLHPRPASGSHAVKLRIKRTLLSGVAADAGLLLYPHGAYLPNHGDQAAMGVVREGGRTVAHTPELALHSWIVYAPPGRSTD